LGRGYAPPTPQALDNIAGPKTGVSFDAASARTDADRVRLESIVGSRYRIEELLGRGQFSSVYRAIRLEPRGEVALKLLDVNSSSNPDLLRRLETAVRASGSLGLSGVVAPLAIEQYETGTVLVMPLLRGGNLATLLHARGPLPLGEVEKLILSLATTLDQLQDRGLPHRGLTPENILFDTSWRPYITDLGVTDTLLNAKGIHGSRASRAGAYAAPEQRRSQKVDGRADQFALAVIAYELFMGARRVESELLEGIQTLAPIQVQADAPLRKDVPLHVNAALRQALSANAANRFATSTEFAEALAGRGPEAARGVPTKRAQFLLLRRHRIAGVLGGMIMVFVIATIADPALRAAVRDTGKGVSRRFSLPEARLGLSLNRAGNLPTAAPNSPLRSPPPASDGVTHDNPIAPPSRTGSSKFAGSNANQPIPANTSSPTGSDPVIIRLGSSSAKGGALPDVPYGTKALASVTAALHGAWTRIGHALKGWVPISQTSAAYIQVSVDRGTALVTIDGLPRGVATVTTSVDPGHHTVTVQGSLNYQPSEQGINASPGDTARVSFRGLAKH